MPEVANAQTVDTVNVANLKTIAETLAAANAGLAQTTAAALGVLTQDLAASAGRRNNIADIAMSQAMNNLVTVDPTEAVSVAKTMTGNDLAQQLAALVAAINTNTQGAKSADITPPSRHEG